MSLPRRVEEACLNAWPAPRAVLVDGWQLRLAGGDSRRVNSVNVVADGTRPLADKLEIAEAFYARHGQPAIVRMTPFAPPGLAGLLDARGYGPPEDETLVLWRPAGPLPAANGVALSPHADEDWLAAHAIASGRPGAAQDGHLAAYRALAIPAVFARISAGDGAPLAVGFAALHDGILCLNNIATAPDARRRGHGAAITRALVGWGESQCAEGAALQVMGSNAPAIALYAGLGFKTELFRYHHRRR
ncbi:MAG: GNAT family N-acetyltransferase [Alphaproteobacteria bacterium]|nr:GNAT family N-acetyltransferase [Alphaproteobacteria bacterium]